MASLAAHAAALAAAFWVGSRPAPPRPPVYRVALVGAPAGVRQAGIVAPPDPAPPAEAPELGGAERVPPPPAAPAKPPKPKERPAPRATPSPVRTRNAGRPKEAAATGTALPKAGAGASGGKGADVANVRTDGIAFPFPGYLANIVRQLARTWSPRRTSAVLVAEVRFLIHRDGSVADIEVVRPSGDRLYDLDAAGAVESVGAARGFGRLPAGWQDDVLVVYFTFDYALRPQ